MSEKKEIKALNNNNIPNRGGRPKGALSINSSKSIELLAKLGFNPLEKLVEQYESISQQLIDMDAGKIKSSAILRAQLETLKKGIADTLMKYSYKPVPTASEQVIENKTPLKITLTGVDE